VPLALQVRQLEISSLCGKYISGNGQCNEMTKTVYQSTSNMIGSRPRPPLSLAPMQARPE